MNGVLLDTGFLIALSIPTHPSREAAVQFYRGFIEHGVPMYLSTVAIAEFTVKQPVTDLPLRNFIVLPFNIEHAMACGPVTAETPRDEGDDRVRVKDDHKLIAQCTVDDISHLISRDSSSLAKYARKQLNLTVIPLDKGYDDSWFTEGDQRGLGL